ncbi:hypothetical protein KFU94_36835 [Chloroflexi bacterium TSY]|nr:hypothetical protein [Chloroflexi bacterium TSY]
MVRLWEIDNPKRVAHCRHVLTWHQEMVTAIVFNANGQRMASASADKTVRIWDVATGDRLAVLHGHAQPIECIAFDPSDIMLHWQKDGRCSS